MKKRMILVLITAVCTLTACGQAASQDSGNDTETQVEIGTTQSAKAESTSGTVTTADTNVFDGIDTDELFTKRDLEQSPDLTDAVYLMAEDGKEITIDAEGIYVLSGDARNCTVCVEAGSDAKVQLVLKDLNISNADSPCIYVKSADKVFVTTLSESSLSVSGSFTADGETDIDAVIFSKEDLVLNGTGTLTITSSDNGISSKDSLKVTGGTLQIECEGSALEAHDAIEIADGSIVITDCNDGLHAEDNDDDSTGYIYIGGGELSISAADDAIHATTLIRIDDGQLEFTAAEGIEATVIRVNGGDISISASDDGINAAQKSSLYTALFEMNGGNVTIVMGAGDTDGVDSNGNIRINGGTIDISGQSTFDYDGSAEYNGGTIIENGEETNTITNQTFGGPGGMGGMGERDNMHGRPGAEGPGAREDFGQDGEPPRGASPDRPE
ncbi:MAG: carbohydrate-binding domain-containing protein [Lachnospiraceae bacterium]|nr:carbohydrate-binding domain-containing protein [Lachnospiraceae bacterium]